MSASLPRAANQRDAFQKIWSLKEAFVKARGDGLAFDLAQLDFCISPGDQAVVRVNGVLADDWYAPSSM